MKKYLLLCFVIFYKNAVYAAAIYELNFNNQKIGILAGSIHDAMALDEDTYKKYEKIAKISNTIFLEYDLNILSNESMKKITFRGQTLQQIIKKNNYQCLDKMYIPLSQSSPNRAQMYGLAPSILYSTIANPRTFGNSAIARSHDRSLDSIIIDIGLKNKSKFIPLENAEEMFEMLLNSTDEEYAKALEIFCKKNVNGEYFYTNNSMDGALVIDLLKKNDVDELRKYNLGLYRRIGRSESIEKTFFSHREDKFVKKIVANIKNAKLPLLVVVGAAHLGGNGLISKLKVAGFTVTQAK